MKNNESMGLNTAGTLKYGELPAFLCTIKLEDRPLWRNYLDIFLQGGEKTGIIGSERIKSAYLPGAEMFRAEF